MNRRTFLADAGLGFPALALASMLHRDGLGADRGDEPRGSPGQPHFPPKAKSVIWLFMIGGVSHMESFDPKPALTKYAGLSIDDTPHKDVLASPYLDKNLRVVDTKKKVWKTIYPLQVGVGVPAVGVAAVELHEAHAALHQPSRQQAAQAELGRLLAVQAVQPAGRLRLLREVDPLGERLLHPERQLVRLHAGPQLRVGRVLRGREPVQVAE